MRNVVLALANTLAMAWFFVGLVSPLTPSEGCPTVLDLLINIVVPLGVLGGIGVFTRERAAWVLLGVEAVTVVGLAIWIVPCVFLF